ncbi:hypothetical protein GHT06_010993 [Daphnia sinensis]|uniref:Platelet-derived growth factor (PDGF) family profile domain-containing protein n=1 Tax=Daphnia sinensis TaxID=1820382 RepID=A0AAD5LIU3_9CRUS|nr:hypothetical protein GHT06_010993 [Daphnia sinensis]
MASCLREPSVLFLLTLSVILVLADASTTPKVGEKRVGFKKNVNIARQWTCKNPQPRLVYVGQMEEYAAPNVVYLPSALLVHRCDDSAGCCLTPGQTCSSVEHLEEVVSFVVHAVVSSDAHGHHHHASHGIKKREKKVTVSMNNHTQCECVGRNNLRARRSSFVHRLHVD